ncbi:MAG: hypothetical protein QNJ12_17880 [Ilumatobacter sp.]|uniref:aldose 1-epimerase n=1 Tax=Ilumatobacter sp. TaxID=1967498 RepID=UPI0026066EE6|nr:hypothetical protein [Ilumatobacter sp.]MDJ0770668.1 hypothetical protein [Ilumatobacter sp.]
MPDHDRTDPSQPGAITIGGDRLNATIAPDAGGRVAQITAAGAPLLIGRDDLPPGELEPIAWGAYPMVPWAGRIRRGRFTFEGRSYQLPINRGDHAIHGVGFTSRWTVHDRAAHAVTLTLDLPTDETWPFGGRAEQRIEIADDRLGVMLAATAGPVAMPISLGWHPWFRKPDRLDFRPSAMYRRDDDGITVDELVEVPAPPWDDCFVNRRAVRADIGDVTVEVSSDVTDWVVYTTDRATCIEPQTAPPDAFTIRPRTLTPGATLQLAIGIRVDA